MRNRGGIIALLIALVLISGYFLARTWKVNSIRNDAEAASIGKDGKVNLGKKQHYIDSLWKQPVFLGSTVEDLTKKELGLGLDLQGGMHVILEVSPVEIVRALAVNKTDPKFLSALASSQKIAQTSNTNFVDIFSSEYKKVAANVPLSTIFASSANRGTLSLNSSDNQVANYVKGEVSGAFDRAFRIIQTRVDQFGVSNPNLQRLPGTNRIQVELPGVDNPERVRKLLSGAAKLEFCEVYEMNDIAPAMQGLASVLVKLDAENKPKTATPAATDLSKLAAKTAVKADTSKKSGSLADQLAGKTITATTKKDTSKVAVKTDSATLAKQQQTAFSNLFIATQGGLVVKVKDSSRVNSILQRPDVKSLFPNDLTFVYDRKPVVNTTNEEIVNLYAIRDMGHAPLEGDVISDARQDYDDRGKAEVSMRMNGEGARKWKNLTAANIQKRVAIILDNYVYSAPVVQNEIPNGNSSISGNFTVEEAQDLANVLKAGKLPAPTNIIEEAVVGASVGSKAVSAGVISSIIGIFVVLVFMLFYYKKSGAIADIALFVNLFLMLGFLANFGATLTLPGIAGIVLSIGMSVDANVLIYERIKEELALGKPFPLAVREGFKHAMSSILDSNATSFITALILFIFGTGLIKGFATTLLIGIVTSLISAVFISRLIFEYYISKGKTVSFVTSWSANFFKNIHFDFISRRKLYYTISGTIIVLGIISIFFKGFGLGVDFKGGRTYVAKFEKTVNTDQVRDALAASLAGSAVEVKTFGGFDQVKITTPYKIDNTSPEVEREITAKINSTLANVNGNKGEVVSSSKVGPTIANDTIWSALKAVVLSILLVFIFIYIRFRSLAFGYGAVVALFHDVFIILGVFSILNGFLPFSLDVDQAFVGAVLTIMGYSMLDTVVIFDRVREYLTNRKGQAEPVSEVINKALNSTLSRTAVTGLLTLMILLVLLIFGGETIRGFIFAMFIGVIVGTYSSLFVATPIVVDALQSTLDKEAAKLAAQPVVVPIKGKKV
jgi:SecD/SecF fusion protein